MIGQPMGPDEFKAEEDRRREAARTVHEATIKALITDTAAAIAGCEQELQRLSKQTTEANLKLNELKKRRDALDVIKATAFLFR